jgi:endonuclease III
MGRFRTSIPKPQEDMIQLTTSPFGLLEELFSEDPWKLLLSAILLNRTSRLQVDVTLCRFLQQWPNAESTAAADWEEISKLIAPLGIRHRRAKGLIRFSKEYLDLVGRKRKKTECTGNTAEFNLSRNEILGLYYCGEYAAQGYRIFIQKRLVQMTCDHALQAYVDYKRGSQSIGHVAL